MVPRAHVSLSWASTSIGRSLCTAGRRINRAGGAILVALGLRSAASLT